MERTGGPALTAAGLERLERAMQRYVDQGKVAGIVTVLWQDPDETRTRTYGVLDLETGDPMRPDTLMRIASLTKPVTAAATLMLVEAGRLALDDPVSRFIPGFDDLRVLVDPERETTAALAQPITVKHLLTHTGGLAYGLFDGPVESRYRRADVIGMKLAPLIETLRMLPLVAQPGERFHYSIGYDVLGYLIQVVADRPFDTFLRERIFEPLGMRDTGFVVPEILADRLATFYTAPNGDIQPLAFETTRAYVNPDRPRSGGGGLVSTAQDYLRFMRMIHHGGELEGVRLLQPKTVRQMTTNQLPGDQIPIAMGPLDMQGMGYGYGFGVKVTEPVSPGDPSRGVYWWAGITSTLAWGDPHLGLIGIVMLQAARYWEVPFTFQRLAYRALER